MRTCSSCRREFTPSSRHRLCPACRSRDTCTCGLAKQKKHARCWSCWVEKGQTGSANHHWRGGRTKHHAGYLMIRVPEHPRGGSKGYVFEHILVMEARLGRHLLANESVHHRNGVRDDNRPGNLELWTRPQPSGIRAEDAVEWARDIIRRYGDLFPDTSNNVAK